ncbi:hypothetical protein CH249_07010 [Rhodococcus sp. 05-2255-3B1]|nr:hypothetical protein CH250_11065 [Rhodococcus sp. 05-2255-3C]OZE14173.1 hypothetical protein CH249_07010 [Rhodococcus sp. 05-2255-3B1]OZE24744.1 hypothetical protein CH255_00885 [Rhodococcus sp. 05-2255-2A2]
MTLARNAAANDVATLLTKRKDPAHPCGWTGFDNEHVAEVSAWHSNLSKETHRMLGKWSDLQL